MKHITISCSKHDRTAIRIERNSIDYRTFVNIETELKNSHDEQ